MIRVNNDSNIKCRQYQVKTESSISIKINKVTILYSINGCHCPSFWLHQYWPYLISIGTYKMLALDIIKYINRSKHQIKFYFSSKQLKSCGQKINQNNKHWQSPQVTFQQLRNKLTIINSVTFQHSRNKIKLQTHTHVHYQNRMNWRRRAFARLNSIIQKMYSYNSYTWPVHTWCTYSD